MNKNKDIKKWVGIVAVIVSVIILLVLAIILLHFDVIGFLKDPMTILLLFVLGVVLLISLFLKFGKSR